MACNLTIDQGNSSAKLVLWDEQGRIVHSEHRHRLAARDIAGLSSGHDIKAAIYSTVLRRQPLIIHALQKVAGHVIEFTTETPSPLIVDYNSKETLGLDRLAAAVGAYSLPGNSGSDLLIVDIGTAITYDRVTADAHYAGGNIAAGIFMRLKALNHYTARLPLVDPRMYPNVAMWGDNTRSALLAGAVRGVAAELEYYHRQLGDRAKVVMTGGDAGRIAPYLSFEVTIEPNLVPFGLNKIIEYQDIHRLSF